MMLLRIWDLCVSLAADESGASAIEYGLIAAGISVALAGVIFAFGETLVDTYETITVARP